MSDIESDNEDLYHSIRDDDELDGFVVSDEEEAGENQDEVEVSVQKQAGEDQDETDPPSRDRIREMTTVLKPNETQTQKLLKAHISVLVSALGGVDYSSPKTPPPYKLGHDALACLKDIKRWIKTVDQRTQTFDVALACAESGLLTNDLTVMLCQWDTQLSRKEPVRNAKITEKIMLANLELMNQLTWPFELDSESSERQRLTFSNIKKAQILYKKHILHYNKGQVLKAVLRLVLPTMAKDKQDWEPRDTAILTLVLSFIRNILYTSPITSSVSTKIRKEISNLDNMPASVTMEDISMNNVLSCFKRNKVLSFLTTVSSSVGSDFDRQLFGPVCLECIFLIIKNVDSQHIANPSANKDRQEDKTSQTRHTDVTQEDQSIATDQPMASAAGMQLGDLLKAENRKKKHSAQNLSTRHGRFGTLLSIQGDEQSYVISGQEALLNSSTTLDKLDKSKKWNRAKTFRYDSDLFVRHEKVYLNTGSLLILQDFVNQFLVGDCFNNLVYNVSALITSDDSHKIDSRDRASYFLTIAWFLSYKHSRNEYFKSHPSEAAKLTEDDDTVDFASIKEALSEVNFHLILNHFRDSFSTRDWNSVHVAMVVFLQLLLISHALFKSVDADKEDENGVSERELGEGVIRNLFTSYDFLNVLVQLPQTASKHSPTYLKTCIHIVHILLKAFESFAKENVKLYIQRRRRKVKSRGNEGNAGDIEARLNYRLGDLMDNSDDEEDDKRAKEETHERELDLQKTEERFFHTATVTSYVDFLAEYEDLTHDEIKRCLSYFHRLFVIRKDYTGLYRLDFMYIMHKIRNYLPRGSSIRKHVEEFIVYFMKKFKVAFARFPNPVEILFPRFDSTEFKSFLGKGELTSKKESSSQPRMAKDIDFIREFSTDEKVKLLVSALFLQEKESFLSWFVSALEVIIQQRLLDVSSGSADESKAIALHAPDKFRRLFINNPYIRCLMSLIKFELPDVLEDNCELPGSIATTKVVELLDLLKKHISQQPATFEDGKDAFFFFTVKDEYGYNDDGEYNDAYDYEVDGERIAFETQGTNAAVSSYRDELDRLDQLESQLGSHSSRPVGVAVKKSKKKVSNGAEPKKSRSKTHKTAREPRGPRNTQPATESFSSRSFKSSDRVHDSDDDSDEDRDGEFFAREEKLRLLIAGSGGISDQKQLEEFKKAWSTMILDKGKDIGASVSKAIADADASLVASNSESQTDYNYLTFGATQTSQSQNESQLSPLPTQDDVDHDDSDSDGNQAVNESTKLDFSSSSDEESADDNSGADKDEEKENQAPLGTEPTKSRKRQILLSDDEDSDGEEVSFLSANDSTNVVKKRRAVIEDEDDD